MIVTMREIFHYIFKWKFFIMFSVVVCVVLSYLYVQKIQSYSANIIIQFEDASVSEGQNPDGTDFDINEITSPTLIIKTLEDLSLHESVDKIRSSLTIKSITPAYVEELQAAKTKDGEEYTYHPNQFIITYNDKRGAPQGELYDILDALVNNYIQYYNQTYINQAYIIENNYAIENENYDYIEIADLLDDNIHDVMDNLSRLSTSSQNYRSPESGYTFSDLHKKYNELAQFDMPLIYSEIYEGQITKNREVLLKKYQHNKNNYTMQSTTSNAQAENTLGIIHKFADANRDLPNAYNQAYDSQNDDDLPVNQNGLERDDILNDTTYDDLMDIYVDYAIASSNYKIEAEHCQEVIDIFSAEPSAADPGKLLQSVTDRIAYVQEKLQELNEVTDVTMEDYNTYLASRHVSQLTGIQVVAKVRFLLYAVLAFILGAGASTVFALAFEIFKKFQTADKHKKVAAAEDSAVLAELVPEEETIQLAPLPEPYISENTTEGTGDGKI